MSELFSSDPQLDDFRMPGDEAWAQAVADSHGAPEAPAAAPAETPQAEEPAADTPAGQEPLRNELGQFVSRDTEAAAETAAEAAAEPAEPAAAEPELILGKFRDPDALAAAYQHLEQDRGRLATEVGDLRRLVEQSFAARPEPAPAPTPQQVDVEAAREWLDQNPTRIQETLQHAFAQENDTLVAVALKAWDAIDEVGAEQARLAVATARAARVIQQQQDEQTQRARQQEQAWNAEAQQFIQAHPDFEQRAPAMRTIVEQNNGIARLLNHEDPSVRAGALDTLYTLAGTPSGQPPAANLTATAEQIARNQALAAEQAIKDATVASTTTTAVASPPSRAQEIAAEWDNLLAPYAVGPGGWNVS